VVHFSSMGKVQSQSGGVESYLFLR
jgi:hypothetical protein